MVWPDSFHAAIVSRQNWSRSAQRRRVFGIGGVSSWVRKPRSYTTLQGVPRPDAYEIPDLRCGVAAQDVHTDPARGRGSPPALGIHSRVDLRCTHEPHWWRSLHLPRISRPW